MVSIANNCDLDNSKEYNLMLINTKYDLYFNARGLVICTAGKATSFYIVETLTRIWSKIFFLFSFILY